MTVIRETFFGGHGGLGGREVLVASSPSFMHNDPYVGL